MSVSLTMLPLALAMRVVMGKENFDRWVESQQIKVATNLSTESDLLKAVKGAGFDAKPFGKSFKTHFDGAGEYFFWDLADGRWVAVFSKHTPLEKVSALIAAIEEGVGHTIFDARNIAAEDGKERWPTNFTDGELLISALVELGGDPLRAKDGSILCKVHGANLRFAQQGDAPFSVHISNKAEIQSAYRALTELDSGYKRGVQTSVYENVKARAKSFGFTMEHEDVLPDKTIVMTLRID